MKHILIISPNPRLIEAMRMLLQPEDYTLFQKPSTDKAETLLEKPLFDACLLDSELKDHQPIRQIESIRALAPKIPLIVLSGETRNEWEEDAYLKGADFVMGKPVRGPLLNAFLERLAPASPAPRPETPEKAPEPHPSSQAPARPFQSLFPTLEVLRDFSPILSHSLHLESLMFQFALKLREIIGVNRIILFMEKPHAFFLDSPTQGKNSAYDCVCAVGVPADLFEYFSLTPESGIGQAIVKSGQIIRSDPKQSEFPFGRDPEIDREFEILGGKIAIPILDRERPVGVAVIGSRLTGHPLLDEELSLIYHLLEELALAVKNTILHKQLASDHKFISKVLSQVNSGCLVVDRDLNILHANPALVDLIAPHKQPGNDPVEFADIPKAIASPLYQVAQTGHTADPFVYQWEGETQQVLRVSIIPFHADYKGYPAAAMMFLEDFTQVEKAKRADVETENAKTVGLIAERFAHEIRNALVPLSTHHQLLESEFDKPDFRRSLDQTMERQIGRISRFADQMVFLSSGRYHDEKSASLGALLRRAFDESQKISAIPGEMDADQDFDYCKIRGDLHALKSALMEILLNGLQAADGPSKITVRLSQAQETDDLSALLLDFSDEGPGFTEESARQAVRPFFTTRNVGVGLGLTVAKKVIEAHGGELHILTNGENSPSIRIKLLQA